MLNSPESCRGFTYELLFVDDGSVDESYEILANLHASDHRVKVVRLAGNFGQHAALSAGIECAKGQVIVSLDADLQCDPDDIPKLLAKIDEGLDVVSSWCDGRKDPLLRRLPSYIANKTIGMVTGVHLRDYGCPLKAITAEVARGLKYYGEMRRFLGALVAQVGRSVVDVQVSHRSRMAGISRYSLLRSDFERVVTECQQEMPWLRRKFPFRLLL
jgi:glycosyltransferase involved in cell wall biosynthesis